MSAPKRSRKTTTAFRSRLCIAASLMAALWAVSGFSQGVSLGRAAATEPPVRAVKLVFVHHSCGENWLNDSHGGLGRALAKNNYFVSDTNYGWGPDSIGDRTDITDWPEWFTGSKSREVLRALYGESGRHCEYTRIGTDPGGENQIVMFKSCFPNSNLEGRPTDGPARGEGLTVANAKAIYRDLLAYFATRPDRLFIAVAAPPVRDGTFAANARAFNSWLVREWLAGYRGENVAVFDFYNVLTGPRNHHRLRKGRVEHTFQPGMNTLYYPSNGDDHPSSAGNRKATEEFVPLLNLYYSRWAATKPRMAAADRSREEAGTPETPPVAPPPPPAPPAGSFQEGRIDDFEGGAGAWAAFVDEAKDTRLGFAPDREHKHGGAASLRIHYDLARESWAACSLVYDQPRDWSGSRGLSFHLRAEKAGQPITVVAYGGQSPEDLLHFEWRFEAGRAAVDGWQRIDIPWDRLRLPEWQGDASRRYDPRSAMGVGFTFQSPGDAGHSGRLWIDDMSLQVP